MIIPKIIGIIDENPFDPLTWSGSSRFFFESLKREGILIDAFSADPGIFWRRFSQVLSFSPDVSNWKRKYHLNTFLFNKMANKVAKQIIPIKNTFDVILQVGAWYNLLNKKELDNKLFCSYHDGNLAAQIKKPGSSYSLDTPYIKKAFEFEQKLYQNLDLIFPMSEWLRKSFISDFKINSKKVISVGAGINLSYVPEISNKDYSNKNILFVGVDFKRKGGEIVLDAFKKIRKEIPDVTLTIIGPELKNLPDGINCLGRIRKDTVSGEKKLCEAYSKASIFVMPSFYEPFGIAFAEAMAHKLPCIGTDNCAMPEIIDHGETGVIISIGDTEALANHIIDLLKDGSELNRLGENGYKKYLSNYTWEIVAKKMTHAISAEL